MYNHRIKPAYGTTAILMALFFVVSGWTTETLLCGFEQAELSTWPISIAAGKGDTNEIAYGINFNGSQCFMTRHAPSEATQGEWVLCHEVFASNPPASELIRLRASFYQDWSYLNLNKLLDTNRTWFGEYNGPVEYNVPFFCTLFGLFHIIDKLPAEVQDWSAYDYLYVDVRTTLAKVYLWVGFEGKYRPANTLQFEIDSGSGHTLRIPIREMAWVGDEDMTDVKNLTIMLRDVKGPTALFIDNIRLVTQDVAPILPVIEPQDKIVAPWLLTTYYKPPAEPPSAPVVLNRTTGPVTPTPAQLITDKSSDAFRVGAMTHGIISCDNERYAVIDRLDNYRYWASPPEPNSNPGGAHTCHGWIGSVDAGQTWGSDAAAGAYSLQFSTANQLGTYHAVAESDNMLRGYGYFLPMGFCGDYSPGNAFPMYNYFFRLQPGPDRWEVYPHLTYAQAPAYPNNIIASDIPRGCLGGIRFTVLPSGRMWCSIASNHLNRLKGYWGLFASFSDDGGLRWQYPQKKKAAVYEPGKDEGLVLDASSPVYLVPYQGKVLCFIDQSPLLYYTLGDGQSWTSLVNMGNIGYNAAILAAMTYRDSVVFAALNGGLFLRFANGSAILERIMPTGTWPYMTLVGERLWYLRTSADSIYCRKYFINENRWTDETLLFCTESTIVNLKVATVSPPSHVPLVWRENKPGGGYTLKMVRIPIDAEEAALDPDYDGLENTSETAYGTDPGNPDSDGDGLWDGQEVVLLTTDPKKADTDDDGDNDGVELYAYTNPKDANSTATQNRAPVISVKDSVVDNTIYLNADATTDAESDWLRYFWEIDMGEGDTIKAEGSRIVCTFPDQTLHSAKLIVDDGRGNQVEQGLFLSTGAVKQSGKEGVSFGLLENTPNPFNPSTKISYGLSLPQSVELAIYDLSGRLVRLLVSQAEKAGKHSVEWNGCDQQDRLMGSGVYLIKLKAENKEMVRRAVLIK